MVILIIDREMLIHATGVYKLGDLKLDFSRVSNPKKKKIRSKTSWIPAQNHYIQKVKIGQVIQPERNTVEFIGQVGKKVVGLRNFQYDDIHEPTRVQNAASNDDDETVEDESDEYDESDDESEISEEELFVN